MAWQNPKTNWKAGDIPTASDFNRIEGNIEELENTKETPTGAQAKVNTHAGSKQTHGISGNYYIAKTSRSDQLPAWNDIQGKPDLALAADLAAHKADYANLVDRVNNLNTNDIQARREILDIKLKLDEQQVIEFLNKTGIGFYDLFEDSGNIDMTNTTATVDTTSADVIFNGQKTLKMKPQVFDDFNALELALYYKGEQKTLKVENNVFNSTQIDVMISSGSVTAGEKYYYNGEVYTVIGVQEV